MKSRLQWWQFRARGASIRPSKDKKTNTPHANNSSDMLCLSWLQALAVVAGRLAKVLGAVAAEVR